MNRLRTLVLLALLTSLLLTWRTTPASATGGILQWDDGGDTFTTFGQNAAITIHTGSIEFVNDCSTGTNDGIYPRADIYIITAGMVPALGGDLKAASIMGGVSATVQGSSGGAFVDETIGYTKPTGKIGPGIYSVVYNECQDGILGPHDEVFNAAFKVGFPSSVPPPPGGYIADLKAAAHKQSLQWLTTWAFSKALFKRIDKLRDKLPADLADQAIARAEAVISSVLNVDPREIALNELYQNYHHYDLIYNDPPDPNYQQVTALGARQIVDPRSADPLDTGQAGLETAASNEQSLNGALLTALERYEGAQAARDGDWALVHARELKRYAGALATQLSTTNASLAALSSAVAADTAPLDSIASTMESWRQNVVSSGFSSNEITAFKNLGLSDPQVADVRTGLATDSYAFTKTGMSSTLSNLQDANRSQISALNNLSSAMDPIISQLASDPNVAQDAPVASAGGPYTVGQGGTLTVTASATSPSPITSYAWDLEGDGKFDDATGPTASINYTRPFQGLIGVSVTNAAGLSDVAYAPVTVTETNKPPSITSYAPTTPHLHLLATRPQQFSVTTADAEGDTPAITWWVDGASAGNGNSFTYTPAATTVGCHVVQAQAVDGNNPSGFSTVQTWYACTYPVIPANLVVSPSSTTVATGSTERASVTLTDTSNTPIPNFPVTLTITGTNSQTLQGTTNNSGLVNFTYVGTNTGDDALVASISGVDQSGATQTSSSSPVTVHWFTPSVPTAPTNLQIQRQSGGVYVSWQAPTSDGGLSIDGYDLTLSNGASSQTQHLPASARNSAVWNLTGGTQYTVSLTAHSALGSGSAATTTFTAGYLPGQVTNMQMTAGNGSLTVTWSPPASDGGLPIDHYTVAIWDCCLGQTLQVTGLTARFIGLRPGDTYHVAVTAHNGIGDGPGPGTPPTITLPHISLPYAKGDVFVGVDGALVYHLDSQGNFLSTLDTGSSTDATGTGMCFDSAGNLYATTFFNEVSKFDGQGNLTAGNWAHSFATPESCAVDAKGNVYVGDAGVNTITKLDPSGNVLAKYTVAIDDRGTDWVDLASDQCTLYYSSEGDSVKRFNVCTNTQLPDFATGLAGPCYALRIRPNGEVMIACQHTVYRLNPQGGIIQTYSGLPKSNLLFALNLDPDGTSFWTADYYTRTVYKIDIAGGQVLAQFTAPKSDNGIGVVGGLAVFGEIRVALMANQAPMLTIPGDQSVPYDDMLSFKVSATDPDGDKVSLGAGGLPSGLSFKDNGDGTGSVSGTVQAPQGSNDVTITADDGQSANNTDVKHLTIIVTKEDTTLTYTGDTVTTRGDSAHLSAVLKEDGTTPLAGQVVALALGGQSCTGTTDGSGTASCSISPVTVAGGAQTTTASFSGDHSYSSSTDSTQVLVQVQTTLAFPAASATTADYHDPASLGAVLVDDAGNPISGASITFSLGAQTCSGTSDSSGAAACTITPNSAAGSYPLRASFGGMNYYLPSNASGTFTATKEETQVRYTGPTLFSEGATAQLAAMLQEDGSSPIAGQTVTLSLAGQRCTGSTDAHGKVSCSLAGVTAALGPQTVTVAFAGDPTYKSSSASQPALVYAWPSSGSFIVGDGSASPNSTVTYWGAQWAKVNTLTGGAAPSAFKGFADTPSSQPPTCGGTWTSNPGNSSTPPANVPPYMAVIVSSSVSKTGSTVSGNIARIVIVKTDPGYGPNPGSTGTGTAVAQLCP